MSFIKQLLNPFVEFEEAKKQETVKTTKPVVATPAVPLPPVDENAEHPLIISNNNTVQSPAQIPVYSPAGTIAGALPEHQRYFEKLIDDANANNPLFKGADYKEFVDSKIDIDDIQDEALKYKTAFNVFKTAGLTKEKLLSTGQEYLNIIGRDMNVFQSAHAQQYKKEVAPKEQLIQRKAEELQALTQRINALKGEINSLTQDNNIAKEKLSIAKKSFLLAGENKQKEIETELQKIAHYF